MEAGERGPVKQDKFFPVKKNVSSGNYFHIGYKACQGFNLCQHLIFFMLKLFNPHSKLIKTENQRCSDLFS